MTNDETPAAPEIFPAVAIRNGKAVTCWAKREGAGFRCAALNGPTWFVTAVYRTIPEAIEDGGAENR